MSTEQQKSLRDEIALDIFIRLFQSKIDNKESDFIRNLIGFKEDHAYYQSSIRHAERQIKVAYALADLFRKARLEEFK